MVAGLVDPAAAASNWGSPRHRTFDVPRLLCIGSDARVILDGAPRVDGGFFRALAHRLDGPVYSFVTSRAPQVYFGKRLNFNPTRNTGGWICASCRIQALPGRGCSTSLRTRGVLSLWIKGPELGVVYSDGRLVMDWIETNWSIDGPERNRLMHALNGNISPDVVDVAFDFPVGNYYQPLEWDTQLLSAILEETTTLIGLARTTDNAGPDGSLLSEGPRFLIKGLFKKKDAQKRSKSNQAHSDKRNNRTIAEMVALLDDEGVETWCRFHRPKAEDVPNRDNDYIRAYRNGGRRSHSVGHLEDDWVHHLLVRYERLRQDVTLNDAYNALFSRLPGVEEACKYHAVLNGNNGNRTNTDDHAMRVNMLERMNTGDMITAAMSDLNNHHLANPVFNLYGSISTDPVVMADAPTIQPLLAAGGISVAFELGARDVLQEGYYITRGYLNAYREGDNAYRHVFNGRWHVDVEIETTGGVVNHLLQDPGAVVGQAVMTAGGLRYPRLLRKLVTIDPATGGVRPDWTVLYVFYTDGMSPARFPGKTMLVADDAGRGFSAIIGPHNCVLHDGLTGTLNYLTKSTYNDMLRNYTSGQSLAVVRRNTLAMYRQGRDQHLSPESASAWCDFMACYATPMLLRAAISHHPTRSRLITDAFNGVMRWRWGGLWDPYAYDRHWGMAVETHPINPYVRYATYAYLLWRVHGWAGQRAEEIWNSIPAFRTLFPTGLPSVELPAAPSMPDVVSPVVGAWRSSWMRDICTGNLGLRLRETLMSLREIRNEVKWETLQREAALARRALSVRPEEGVLSAVDSAVANARPFLPSSALEPTMTLPLAIPILGSIGVGVLLSIARRRKWWPDYTSGPMGRWSEFWRRLPVAMHRTARLVKWSTAPNVDGNLVYQTLPAFAHSQFASHAKGTQNYVHSFCMRVGRVTPDPQPHMIAAYERAFEALTDAFNGVPIFPTNWADFIARFPPAKRRDYEEARELFDTWGVRLWEGRRNRLLNRQSFLKHELNLHFPDAPDGASHKDPRTIMTLHTTIQATMGPWFHAYGERLLRVCEQGVELRPGVRARVAFGMTKHQLYLACRDEHLECETYIVVCGDDAFFRHLGVIYFVDGQRWDAHMKQHMLTPKIKHYRRVGLHPFYCDLLIKLMDRRVVYGKGANQVVGEVFATVSSGDPDTLPGNCVKMVCSLAAITEQDDLWASATALGLVFEVAAEQRILEDPHGDFCSCVIAGSTFISKPGKVLAKLPWVANPAFPAHLVAAAKVQCAIGDLKVFPEICERLSKLKAIYDWESVPQFVVDAVQGKYRTLGATDGNAIIDAPAFFSERYGVDYEVLLLELDAYVHACLTGRDEVDMPSWVTVCALDLGVDYDTHWLHFDSALARRLNREPLPSKPPRRRVARVWNKLMHILNGNIRSIRVLLSVCLIVEFLLVLFSGWAGARGIRILRIQQRTDLNNTFTREVNNMNAQQQQKKNAPKKGQKQQQQPRRGQPRGKKNNQATILGPQLAQLTKQVSKLTGSFGRQSGRPGPFESLGSNVGRMIGGFFGSGDYIVNDIVHQRGTGTLKKGVHVNRITNCEYVRDIVSKGTSDFSLSSSYIQATEETLFPWLKNVSKLYTKYRFTQLVFEYRSMSTDYSAAVGLGTIIMAPQYNVDAPVFTTKQQMEAATHAVSFKPSNSAMMGVECNPGDSNVKWYNVINREEIERSPMTDMGKFNVALTGVPTTVPSGTTLGELWVWYTVELVEPILASAPEPSIEQMVGATVRYTCTDTTAGRINTGAFGYAGALGSYQFISGPLTTFLTPTEYNQKFITDPVLGGTYTPYTIAWNNAPSGSGATVISNIYLGRPGRYIINFTGKFSTALTAFNGFNLVGQGGAIVNYTAPSSSPEASTDRTLVYQNWAVFVPASVTFDNPGILQYSVPSSTTGAAAAVFSLTAIEFNWQPL